MWEATLMAHAGDAVCAADLEIRGRAGNTLNLDGIRAGERFFDFGVDAEFVGEDRLGREGASDVSQRKKCEAEYNRSADVGLHLVCGSKESARKSSHDRRLSGWLGSV